MDRRKSLKIIGLGSLSATVLFDACKLPDKKKADTAVTAGSGSTPAAGPDRQPEEIAHYNNVVSTKFFTEHELATIAILANIIIPKDEVSGSATDAGVPDFIEFIVKDMPEHQVPMRGGLRWTDRECYRRFQKNFKDCNEAQRIQVVDDVAWPKKAKPEMSQGVSFFTLMRNLTCTGFYTAKIGIEDMGYMGNKPNQWNGVPDDVLKQYGKKKKKKEMKECVSYP